MPISRMQRTISQSAIVEGVGYWSGKQVRLEFRPAPAGSGITFVRDDLGPGARIPALAEYRVDAPRRTNLRCEGARVDMVEHVLASLAGLQVDNCEIGVDQQEMPGCDGSALAFVEALGRAGIVEQSQPVECLLVTEPVRVQRGECWIEALPAATGKYQVEYFLEYPYDSVIGRQNFAVELTVESFLRELAPCRTFVLQREAVQMVRSGLGRHVTPRDLLVFSERGVIDNRLRFANECARHKVLDVIGDMALTGCQILGKIVASRSGHQLHGALAEQLRKRYAKVAPLRASA